MLGDDLRFVELVDFVDFGGVAGLLRPKRISNKLATNDIQI